MLLPLLAANAPVARHDVTVTVTDLRSGDGKVLACLTAKPKAFPDCDRDPKAHAVTVDAAETVSFTFRGVAPGDYAISLLHDENGNGKADRSLMVPKEGFGFSRDAKVRFGPPSFSSAAFEVRGGATHQTIRMRYLFR
ncbi:DUF2141 domain-containing protein [Erythrobacter litoralis]|uniref:DUF2141 domain-containing protein n=1 Tax=Erythrobacter litoralis (strain HTCC2594) TaxID=314225 RepID=Q2N6S6_ERYLH|nr:DUF2141 domain-containing protein [Erythrobacter litoralis]ABC64615.1 hypothetical protein ELI_12615 [Erythrobacter litoralis HTCC2594]